MLSEAQHLWIVVMGLSNTIRDSLLRSECQLWQDVPHAKRPENCSGDARV